MYVYETAAILLCSIIIAVFVCVLVECAIAAVEPKPGPLVARPYPGVQMVDVRLVQAELDRIPPAVAARLTSLRVWVFGAKLTALEEFAPLRGVTTPAAGDGDRTYDAVTAVGPSLPGHPVYISAAHPEATIHEVGHAVEQTLSDDAKSLWRKLWATSDWATDYERLNCGEAFAESFRRWVEGEKLQPGILAFMHYVVGGKE